MRIKHPKLIMIDNQFVYEQKSQFILPKDRDTSAMYYVKDNRLIVSKKEVAKHPKFKNITQFENWLNRYFYKQNPWILNNGEVRFLNN